MVTCWRIYVPPHAARARTLAARFNISRIMAYHRCSVRVDGGCCLCGTQHQNIAAAAYIMPWHFGGGARTRISLAARTRVALAAPARLGWRHLSISA